MSFERLVHYGFQQIDGPTRVQRGSLGGFASPNRQPRRRPPSCPHVDMKEDGSGWTNPLSLREGFRTRPARDSTPTTLFRPAEAPCPDQRTSRSQRFVPLKEHRCTQRSDAQQQHVPTVQAPQRQVPHREGRVDQGCYRGQPSPPSSDDLGGRCEGRDPAAGRCHVAPVSRTNSATAASRVGKKWWGSMVRVSS